MRRFIVSTFLCAAACALASSPARAADRCDTGAFVVTRQGDVNDVEWVSARGADVVHHAVSNQAVTVDGTERVAGDGTSRELRDLSYTTVGATPKPQPAKTIPNGATAWWEYWPSTLQAVLERAARIGGTRVTVPIVEVTGWKSDRAIVERPDGFQWTVRVGPKRYDVFADARGCVRSATMPGYAITIEKRASFAESSYPLWPNFAAPPDGAYRALDVRIPAPEGRVLAGTLTLPLHPRGRLPAVITISGISPHDRDEGPGQLRPFRDVADVLTRAGFAVLRTDQRGVGGSSGNHDATTALDEAHDVSTEIDWLAARSDVDPHRIAIVGHSQGGLVTLIAASLDRRVAALVGLAAPGVGGMDVYRYQTRIDVERNPDVPVWDRERRVRATLAEPITGERYTWYVAADPLKYARGVRVPALLAQGGNDLHVPPSSAANIAEAMRSNGNADVTVALFPSLSHTLLPDPGGTVRDWATLPGWRLPNDLLDTVRDWLAARLHPNQPR